MAQVEHIYWITVQAKLVVANFQYKLKNENIDQIHIFFLTIPPLIIKVDICRFYEKKVSISWNIAVRECLIFMNCFSWRR